MNETMIYAIFAAVLFASALVKKKCRNFVKDKGDVLKIEYRNSRRS